MTDLDRPADPYAELYSVIAAQILRREVFSGMKTVVAIRDRARIEGIREGVDLSAAALDLYAAFHREDSSHDADLMNLVATTAESLRDYLRLVALQVPDA